jgi:hypothetical protein
MVLQPLETWRSSAGTQLRRTPLRLLRVAVSLSSFVCCLLVGLGRCTLQSAVLEIMVASEPTDGQSASLRSLQGNLKPPK